jgi:hypothetical protein
VNDVCVCYFNYLLFVNVDALRKADDQSNLLVMAATQRAWLCTSLKQVANTRLSLNRELFLQVFQARRESSVAPRVMHVPDVCPLGSFCFLPPTSTYSHILRTLIKYERWCMNAHHQHVLSKSKMENSYAIHSDFFHPPYFSTLSISILLSRLTCIEAVWDPQQQRGVSAPRLQRYWQTRGYPIPVGLRS